MFITAMKPYKILKKIVTKTKKLLGFSKKRYDVVFTNDWFSHAKTLWAKILKSYKGKNNLEFLEIGCYEGMATFWLCTKILTGRKSRVTAVDTFEGSMEHKDKAVTNFEGVEKRFRSNLAEFIKIGKVKVFKGTSQNYLRNTKIDSFDFIYIDGSHVAADVLEDAVLSWKLLKKNGVLIFDDVGWEVYEDPTLTPKLAVDSFLKVYKGRYKLLHRGYQVAIKKI